MKNIRVLFVLVLFLVSVSSCLAASVVGAWTGKVDLSGLKDPKQAEGLRKVFSTMKFSIVFRADKSYSATFASPKQGSETKKGTWSQSGNTVTTKGEKATQVFVLAANGRSMSTTPKNGHGLKLLFVR